MHPAARLCALVLAAVLAVPAPASGLRNPQPEHPSQRSGLEEALQKRTAGLEEVEKAFIGQVVDPFTSLDLAAGLAVETSQDPGGYPVLSLRHTAEHKGREVPFSYRVEFTGEEIQLAEIPLRGETNVLRIPVPGDGWSPEILRKIRHAWRRMSIADPLNRRYTSTTIVLEDYQQEGVEKGLEFLREYGLAPVVMATATGKTFVAFAVSDRWLTERREQAAHRKDPGAVLYIVNNRYILGQAEKNLHQLVGDRYTSSQLYEGKEDDSGDFIFATRAGLMTSGRLEKLLRRRKIALVIFDEMHHLGSADNRIIFRRVQEKSLASGWDTGIMGFTATEIRPDRVSVLSLFGRRIAFRYPIVRGWAEGTLTRMRYLSGDEDINPENKPIVREGSALREEYREMRYSASRFPHLLALYRQHGEELLDKRALFLCPNIERANALADHFREEGVRAVALASVPPPGKRSPGQAHGQTHDQWVETQYSAWKNGEWPEDCPYADQPVPEVVMAVDIFREGIDVPGIGMVFLWDDTESSINFMQGIGRGLRMAPFKTHLVVVDTVGLHRKEHLLHYLGWLLVEQEGGERQMVGGEPIVARRPETGAAMRNLGVEFGEKVAQATQQYFDEIATHMEYYFGTYHEIPVNELGVLDDFFARRAGFPSVPEMREFLRRFADRLAAGAGRREIGEFRERMLPVFYCIGSYQPEDGPEILVGGTTMLVFNHLCALLQQGRPGLDHTQFYSVFPEFDPERERRNRNRGANLRTIRTRVFRMSQAEMVLRLARDLLPRTGEPLVSPSSALFLRAGAFFIERGEPPTIRYAEAGMTQVREWEKTHGEALAFGERFVTTGATRWQEELIPCYLNHPLLAGKLTLEELDLPKEKFLEFLVSRDLVPRETLQEAFLKQLRRSVQAYHKAAVKRKAKERQTSCEEVNALIMNPAYREALDPQEMKPGEARRLLEWSGQIDNAQAMAKLAPADRQLRENYDQLLRRAGIRWEQEIPEIPRLHLAVTRGKDLRSYQIVALSGPQQPAGGFPPLLVAIREGAYGRAHLFLMDNASGSNTSVEQAHSDLDETGRGILADAVVEALGRIGEMEQSDFACILPEDRGGREFFSDLFTRILETTAWDALGQFENVAPNAAVKVSPEKAERCRMSFLSPAVLSQMRGAALSRPASLEGRLGRLYLTVHNYWTLLREPWRAVREKLDQGPPSAGVSAAFDQIEGAVGRQMENDIVTGRKVEALTQIFDALGADRPGEPLTSEQVVLACLVDLLALEPPRSLPDGRKAHQALSILLPGFFRLLRVSRASGRPVPAGILDDLHELARLSVDHFLAHQDYPEDAEFLARHLTSLVEAELEKPEIIPPAPPAPLVLPTPSEGPPHFDAEGNLLFWSQKRSGPVPMIHWDPDCRRVGRRGEPLRAWDLRAMKRYRLCPECKPPDSAYWEEEERRWGSTYGSRVWGQAEPPGEGESPQKGGLEEMQEVLERLLEGDRLAGMARQGWMELGPELAGEFGRYGWGLLLSDAAEVTDGAHTVFADERLSHPEARRIFPWMEAGQGIASVVERAAQSRARRGDLILVLPEMPVEQIRGCPVFS